MLECLEDIIRQALLFELAEEHRHRRDSVVVVGGTEALREAADGADGVLRDRRVCVSRKCLQHGSEARVVARGELWHVGGINYGLHGILFRVPFLLGERSGRPLRSKVTKDRDRSRDVVDVNDLFLLFLFDEGIDSVITCGCLLSPRLPLELFLFGRDGLEVLLELDLLGFL